MPAPLPIVVSDTSVLIFLAAVEQFQLLRQLYGRLLVPPQVFHEAVEARPNLPGDRELRAALTDGWIEVRAPLPTPLNGWLRSQLDAGESEALALALEVNASIVLMDESDGRRIAARLGFKPTGTLGVLLAAKAVGLIPAVKPFLTRLRERHSFHISDEMVRQALNAAAES